MNTHIILDFAPYSTTCYPLPLPTTCYQLFNDHSEAPRSARLLVLAIATDSARVTHTGGKNGTYTSTTHSLQSMHIYPTTGPVVNSLPNDSPPLLTGSTTMPAPFWTASLTIWQARRTLVALSTPTANCTIASLNRPARTHRTP